MNPAPHLELFLPQDFKLTAVQAVERWDAGRTLWSIEMGGLGPGYEQTIQVLVIEMLRDALHEGFDRRLDGEAFTALTDKTATKHNAELALSGAQVGAARSLAWRAYDLGWTGMLDSARADGLQDRLIQISNHWPRVAGKTP